MQVLTGPVGKLPEKHKGNNKADVVLVQKSLGRLRCTPALPNDGIASDDLVAAIRDFQSSWQTAPDGRIDPNGETHKRLFTLSNGELMLRKIRTDKIAKGGYKISFTPGYRWTRNFRNYLACRNTKLGVDDNLDDLSQLPHCVDVTKCDPSALLSADNVKEFLSCLEALGGDPWGNIRYCALYVVRDNAIVSHSKNSESFTCPVQPYSGTLGLDINAHEALPYRLPSGLIDPTPINGKYWFRYGGEFVTDKNMRGLNCCTYPAAVFRLLKNTDSGEHLAAELGPSNANDVDGGKYHEALDFLADHPRGKYLLWYDFTGGGHVVLVIDGTAYEWSHTAGGYKETTIANRYTKGDKKKSAIWGDVASGKYWIRGISEEIPTGD
jgi:hypothetical protein